MANELSNLHPLPGERKARTRLGRGEGSGTGKTAGRGTKGAGARAGNSTPAGFEGGQMPLHRRLPKFGFKNRFAKEYAEVNVDRLNKLEAGFVVTAASLKSAGIIATIGKDGVKVLGGGDLGVALHVRVSKLSRSAVEKITAAGGTVDGPLPGE
jgi:large subunit ribosomal protein L15